MASANAFPSLTFSSLYFGSSGSPDGASDDRTADACALFSATENEVQGGPRWTRGRRASDIIPTAIPMNSGFNRL